MIAVTDPLSKKMVIGCGDALLHTEVKCCHKDRLLLIGKNGWPTFYHCVIFYIKMKHIHAVFWQHLSVSIILSLQKQPGKIVLMAFEAMVKEATRVKSDWQVDQ